MNRAQETLRVRVTRKEKIALDIAVFEFANTEDGPLPDFSAGAHVDVHIADQVARQYSLCAAPDKKNRYQIAVLLVDHGRGGSRAMHETLDVGDVVTISKPKNRFPLVSASGHVHLFAGGIGITPMICMADELSSRQQTFTLHYFARSKEKAAFQDRLQSAPYADRVRLHFGDSAGSARSDLEAHLESPQPDANVYVCGPQGFMDAILHEAKRRGWLDAQLHQERFGVEEKRVSGESDFEVVLAKSGRSIRISPEVSIVTALAAEGVTVETSCEQGVCGTCLTRVLEGEPDHRDVYLTDTEHAANDQILPCCSRSKSPRLILDL